MFGCRIGNLRVSIGKSWVSPQRQFLWFQPKLAGSKAHLTNENSWFPSKPPVEACSKIGGYSNGYAFCGWFSFLRTLQRVPAKNHAMFSSPFAVSGFLAPVTQVVSPVPRPGRPGEAEARKRPSPLICFALGSQSSQTLTGLRFNVV